MVSGLNGPVPHAMLLVDQENETEQEPAAAHPLRVEYLLTCI